jgi:hypothetical protein
MGAVLKLHLGMIGSTRKKPVKECKPVRRYYPRLIKSRK